MITRGNHISGAIFSDDKVFRYSLWRVWDKKLPRVAFCLLNPSTADEVTLDPTLQRCRRRANGWGFGSMEIVNIFAYRSTNPDKLYDIKDPVGPNNNTSILAASAASKMVIAGWGTHGAHLGRGAEVAALLQAWSRRKLHCLGRTISGHPKHPLYLPYSAKPEPFGLAKEAR